MKRIFVCLALALVAVLAIWGCSNDTSNVVDPGGGDKSCLGCHSNKELLKAALGSTSGSKVLTRAKGGG